MKRTLASRRSKMQTCATLLLLVTCCLAFAPASFAQQGQIQVQAPLDFVIDRNPTRPMMVFAPGPTQTGNLAEFRNPQGLMVAFIAPDGTLQTTAGFTYNAAGSYQNVAADMTIGSLAGTSDAGDSDFLAAIMGNLLGTGNTRTHNYLAGGIFHFSVTGANATTYPSGGVLAGIGDGVTDAHGAVVAYIDGDSAQTNAGAAFKVMHNNSVPGSGFNYGVDLADAAHDGFNAVSYVIAEQRFSNNAHIFTGASTTRAALRAEVDGKVAPANVTIGSFYLSTAGKMYLKVANAGADTDWERVTTSAAD